jgi:hypothetical protein
MRGEREERGGEQRHRVPHPSHLSPLTSHLKDLPSARQDLVECFPEIRRGVRYIPAHLLRIFFPALLDLLLKQLLQIAVAQPLLPLAGVVHDHVGNQRPGKAPSLECRVL